jgi:transketolase
MAGPRSGGTDTLALALAIRRHAVRMTHLGKCSHIGSVLSMADLLAVLYGGLMRLNPAEPRWPARDRFILSKGHASAGLYAALAEREFFDRDMLDTFSQNGSPLCGHVSHKGVPGVELSTGSLGHGLGVGTGMAYSAKLDGQRHRIFVLLSDGECDEGSTWEAALFASHHRLANLVVIIDYNKIQSLGRVEETLALEPLAEKWESFGWGVRSIDGHDHEAIHKTFRSIPFRRSRPSCIIGHTIKGKGVSFMEDTILWHYRSPQGEEYATAMRELDGA